MIGKNKVLNNDFKTRSSIATVMPSADAGIVTSKWTGDPQLVKTQLQLNYRMNGPVHTPLMPGSETPAVRSKWPRHEVEPPLGLAIYERHLSRYRTLKGRVMEQ